MTGLKGESFKRKECTCRLYQVWSVYQMSRAYPAEKLCKSSRVHQISRR